MALSKKTKKRIINIALCIFGSILLGFGTAVFLTKNVIVSGGLSGIAYIIQYYVGASQVVDIVIWVLTGLLWILSIFTLGKEFALQTLISSIFFPLAVTLFYRVPIFQDLINKVAGTGSIGDLLLCAIIGGIINGFGMAITFFGRGSTGGLDVICFLLNKYFHIKVSIGSFILDFVIILSGIFALSFPNYIQNCLCGVIAAIMIGIIVNLTYDRWRLGYVVDIISSKHEEIVKYSIEVLDRTATLIPSVGGYSNENKVMVRIAMSKEEFINFRNYIAIEDPEAFITFTSAHIYGSGWQKNSKRQFKKVKDSNDGK